MVDRVDLVVVGAGLGGLAAAVSAAGEGRHVLVLEQADGPGGYASGFQRGPFRFDASLHALNGLAAGGGIEPFYRELGIWDRLHFRRLDPLYVARFPGMQIVAHADRFRYESELIARFPHEAVGVRAFLDEAVAAHRDLRRMSEDAAAGGAVPPEEFASRHPALLRLSGETAEQTMRRFVADGQARAALGALWVYFGLPPSRLSSVVASTGIASYHEYGGWYPEGGSAAVSRALEESLHQRGGQIRFGQRVAQFEVAGGLVHAVITETGLRTEADAVISNASAPTTMLQLVGAHDLPPEYVARVSSPAPSYTTFAVYLGLGADVFAEQRLPHELFIFPGFDHDDARRASLAGDWANAGLTVTDYTRVDPGCAPPGQGTVVITAEVAWDYADVWGTGGAVDGYHANPAYLAVKERVADALIARADAEVPGLAEAIRYREASTPLTNFAYTGNPKGAIEGYENSSENSGLGWLPQSTPIRNLFLAGAWTNAGGQNPAIQSGVAAAALARRLSLAAIS